MNYETLKGTGSIVESNRLPGIGGQAVLCASGTVRIHVAGNTTALDDCMGMVVVDAESIEYDNARGIVVAIDHQDSVGLNEPFPMDPLTAHLVVEVFFENPRDEAHRQSALSFLLHHLGVADGVGLISAGDGMSAVERVEAYMQVHLDEPLTLDALAEVANLGSQVLVKQFQSARNLSPMQALAEMRADKAKILLAQTETSITQVAHSVGYATVSGFSHFFKKRTGFSPREFRENVQWLV